jgi:hypothetical protein
VGSGMMRAEVFGDGHSSYVQSLCLVQFAWDTTENPGRDSAMRATTPLTPMRHGKGKRRSRGGVLPWCRARNLGHRLRHAVTTNTDRPPEASGGGRRETGILLRVLPGGSGGDNTGYGATSGPDCWASSGPRCINGLRPDARLRLPDYQNPAAFSSYRVPHQWHERLVANSRRRSIGRSLDNVGKTAKRENHGRPSRPSSPPVSTFRRKPSTGPYPREWAPTPGSNPHSRPVGDFGACPH